MKGESFYLLATLAIGFVAQGLFFARTIFQWALSEKEKKVLSPNIYWILSLIASLLFFVYGWLRNDFSILLGQSITYYIYVLNLYLKKYWQTIPYMLRIAVLIAPIIFFAIVISHSNALFDKFFADKSIPIWLIAFGSIGQIIFTFRFIYQIIYSIRRKESSLPIVFWFISVTGSIIILIYGIIRIDLVLIAAQFLGMITYIRNIMIYHQQKNDEIDQ